MFKMVRKKLRKNATSNTDDIIRNRLQLGISYGSLIPMCLCIGIKITGHTIAEALQKVVDSFDLVGSGLDSVSGALGSVPFIGGLLQAPFELISALGDLAGEFVMWFPTVMGNAFDAFFFIGTVIVAIRGLSDIVARYQVEQELLRETIENKKSATSRNTENTSEVPVTDELVKLSKNNSDVCPVTAIEKNENLKELDVYGKARDLSVFTRDSETK